MRGATWQRRTSVEVNSEPVLTDEKCEKNQMECYKPSSARETSHGSVSPYFASFRRQLRRAIDNADITFVAAF